jgi:erythromycin esterase-like protein
MAVFDLDGTLVDGVYQHVLAWRKALESEGRRKRVRPALPDSFEELFHEVGEKSFLVPLGRDSRIGDTLRSPRLERAIGVIYRPDTERQSHYFRARMADQFDAVIHIDETRAVEPLERTARWEEGEVSETYPHAV